MRNNHAMLIEKTVVPIRTQVLSELMKWAQWFETADRHVGKDKVGDVEISTVFLGINHGWFGSDLWFETMIFGGEHDDYQTRYKTYKEAEEGHKRVVQAIKENKAP